MSEPGKTGRGFEGYGGVERDDRGQRIYLSESSAVGRPHCWVHVKGGAFFPPKQVAGLTAPEWSYPTPYLSVDQAKQLRDALNRFIEHAESPGNWRNSDEYREAWG